MGTGGRADDHVSLLEPDRKSKSYFGPRRIKMFSGKTDITMPLGAAGDDSPQPRRHQEISVIVRRKDLPAQTSMVCGPVIVFAIAVE